MSERDRGLPLCEHMGEREEAQEKVGDCLTSLYECLLLLDLLGLNGSAPGLTRRLEETLEIPLHTHTRIELLCT